MGDVADLANQVAELLIETERLRAEHSQVREYIIRNILKPHGVTQFHDDLLGVCDQADHISATAFLRGVKAGLEAAGEHLAARAEHLKRMAARMRSEGTTETAMGLALQAKDTQSCARLVRTIDPATIPISTGEGGAADDGGGNG